MTAVSRKRGTLRQIIAHEGANWAGNKFKEFQTNRTIQILSQKSRPTILSANRGTTQTILESPNVPETKISQVYIVTNRGTKRRLLKIR